MGHILYGISRRHFYEVFDLYFSVQASSGTLSLNCSQLITIHPFPLSCSLLKLVLVFRRTLCMYIFFFGFPPHVFISRRLSTWVGGKDFGLEPSTNGVPRNWLCANTRPKTSIRQTEHVPVGLVELHRSGDWIIIEHNQREFRNFKKFFFLQTIILFLQFFAIQFLFILLKFLFLLIWKKKHKV